MAKHAKWVWACVFALGGCVHQTRTADVPVRTNVQFSAHVAAGTPRYEEKEDEVSNRPTPFEHPLPEYPIDAIALGLRRVVVRARVIVDTEGKVSEVRIVPAEDSALRPAVFDDSVRTALSRWHYMPLVFRRFADVKDEEGNVIDSRLIGEERKPFSMDYDFLFEMHDGKPAVGTAVQHE